VGIDIEIAARLRAFEQGRAILRASHLQVSIQPHALVLCPIAMAGEDTTIHAVAYGRIGRPPTFLVVPDPRIRDDQYRLFEDLAAVVEVDFTQARGVGAYPQVWVQSGAAVGLLDVLADRLRFNQGNLKVKRFGELLTYLAERCHVAGQQALFAVTEVLRRHFATGQQPGEDEHLGALMAWISPPKDIGVFAAVTAAEKIPMGVHTDPAFDRTVLGPLVEAYGKARRAGAPAQRLVRLGKLIDQALERVVVRIYDAAQEGIEQLHSHRLPRMAGLDELDWMEAGEFGFFMQGRDMGIHIPMRDRAKAAAMKLAARLDADENFQRATAIGDQIAGAGARLRGDHLVGRVENGRDMKDGRRQLMTFDVVSEQRISRVRKGDNLCLLRDPRLEVVVTGVRRTGRTTRAGLKVTAGMRAVGLPSDGSHVEFVPGVPDWDSLTRRRIQMARRLSSIPWTHDPAAAPPGRNATRKPPFDVIAAVRRLES
jgi:hypothetical protein